MTDMFESYVHGAPDAVKVFFSEWVGIFTQSIQKAWQNNGGTETNRITISNHGKDPNEYFNLDEYFPPDSVSISLP